VTLPEGTGGFAASWAFVEQIAKNKVNKLAIDTSKGLERVLMVGLELDCA
jgi:hypothetical protein